MQARAELPADISSTVRRALSEDIGTGDLSAELLPKNQMSNAEVLFFIDNQKTKAAEPDRVR